MFSAQTFVSEPANDTPNPERFHHIAAQVYVGPKLAMQPPKAPPVVPPESSRHTASQIHAAPLPPPVLTPEELRDLAFRITRHVLDGAYAENSKWGSADDIQQLSDFCNIVFNHPLAERQSYHRADDGYGFTVIRRVDFSLVRIAPD